MKIYCVLGSASYLALYLKLYSFCKNLKALGIDGGEHKELLNPEVYLKKAGLQI